MYLLDTNVLSALRRPERAPAALVQWAAATPSDGLFLSVVTVFEIELGVAKLARRDTSQAKVFERWLEGIILPSFAGRIFDIDLGVARRCATLHVPDPRAERDAWIAATALVHGLTVVTRNVADFVATGVKMFNPWEG